MNGNWSEVDDDFGFSRVPDHVRAVVNDDDLADLFLYMRFGSSTSSF